MSLISYSCYSQLAAKSVEAKIFQTRLSNKTTTLKINVAGSTINNLNNLKNEYDGWKHKINSVTIDQQNMVLSIEHNGLWQSQEINEMLEKYNIPKGKIISDQ
jgi:hypothetical protein